MTVKNLIKKLSKLPDNARVVYRRNYLADIKNVKYVEDYFMGTTYKLAILNEEKN